MCSLLGFFSSNVGVKLPLNCFNIHKIFYLNYTEIIIFITRPKVDIMYNLLIINEINQKNILWSNFIISVTLYFKIEMVNPSKEELIWLIGSDKWKVNEQNLSFWGRKRISFWMDNIWNLRQFINCFVYWLSTK